MYEIDPAVAQFGQFPPDLCDDDQPRRPARLEADEKVKMWLSGPKSSRSAEPNSASSSTCQRPQNASMALMGTPILAASFFRVVDLFGCRSHRGLHYANPTILRLATPPTSRQRTCVGPNT